MVMGVVQHGAGGRGEEERGAVIGQTHVGGGGGQPRLPPDVLGEGLAQGKPAGDDQRQQPTDKGTLWNREQGTFVVVVVVVVVVGGGVVVVVGGVVVVVLAFLS